jgi:multicomponent Na+:H+ antiporter subunit F
MILCAAAIVAILVSFIMLLVRMALGPTIFDRLLVMNSAGTCIPLIIILLGEAQGTEFYLDIALIYALINFVSTIAFLKYFENRPLENTPPSSTEAN